VDNPGPFYLLLRDQNPEMVMAWLDAFADPGPWSIGRDNILRQRGDAIVSPANSYGHMDGGLDLAYRTHFGLGLQNRLQRLIETRCNGYLPVGEALIVPTLNDRIPRLIAAPTMERPRDVSATENAYLAAKAALRAVRQYNEWAAAKGELTIRRILVPGLATGIGGMHVDTAAAQMRRAANEALSDWQSL
jgi:O-acetyl-ADP-ribose deacetylase (regulator of RNase III)